MAELPSFAHPAMALLLMKVCNRAANHPHLNEALPMHLQISDAELSDIILEHDPTFPHDWIPATIEKVRQALQELFLVVGSFE